MGFITYARAHTNTDTYAHERKGEGGGGGGMLGGRGKAGKMGMAAGDEGEI